MGLADYVSLRSKDHERKVGAVIVKDGNILSFSYNGTVPGDSNIMRDADGKALPTVLHAESNAIAKVAQSMSSTLGSTLYTTLSPCFECAKLIYQVGIARVVWRDLYRSGHADAYAPTEWLAQQGVIVERHLYGSVNTPSCPSLRPWFGNSLSDQPTAGSERGCSLC